MIKPVTFQGCFNFNANLYALEVRSRFIDQSKANGYYSGYGDELDATIVGQKIQIGTGAFIIQGRMCEITAAELVSPQIYDGFVGYVVARIETYHPSDTENCTLSAVVNRTFEAITLEQSDVYAASADNVNTAYEFPIYSFEISGTTITNLTKLIQPVADYATIKTIVDNALATAANALSTANTALANSSQAIETANTAKTQSETATDTAETAKNTADAANATSANALSIANTATTNATNAVDTANAANATSESALTKANEAVEKATQSNTTANTAKNTADAAKTEADTAVETANVAKTQSETASATADDAKKLAETANQTSQDTATAVSELETQIGEKQGTTVTLNGTAQARFPADGLIDESDEITIGGGTV